MNEWMNEWMNECLFQKMKPFSILRITAQAKRKYKRRIITRTKKIRVLSRKLHVLKERKELVLSKNRRKSRLDIFIHCKLNPVLYLHGEHHKRARTPETKIPISLMELCSLQLNLTQNDGLEHLEIPANVRICNTIVISTKYQFDCWEPVNELLCECFHCRLTSMVITPCPTLKTLNQLAVMFDIKSIDARFKGINRPLTDVNAMEKPI